MSQNTLKESSALFNWAFKHFSRLLGAQDRRDNLISRVDYAEGQMVQAFAMISKGAEVASHARDQIK